MNLRAKFLVILIGSVVQRRENGSNTGRRVDIESSRLKISQTREAHRQIQARLQAEHYVRYI